METAIDKGESIEEKIGKFEKVHEKIKFMSFGKITLGRKLTEVSIPKPKNVSKEEGSKALFEEEVKRTNMEIEELKKMKTSNVGRIWDIKKRIIG